MGAGHMSDYEGQINLTRKDLDIIIEQVIKGYIAGSMDSITYATLHAKLFQGYRQIAQQQARHQIKAERKE
jgi:hypothetical protein